MTQTFEKETEDLVKAVAEHGKSEAYRNMASELLYLRSVIARIQRRTDALKSNHPEWANVIDAAVHAEDLE